MIPYLTLPYLTSPYDTTPPQPPHTYIIISSFPKKTLFLNMVTQLHSQMIPPLFFFFSFFFFCEIVIIIIRIILRRSNSSYFYFYSFIAYFFFCAKEGGGAAGQLRARWNWVELGWHDFYYSVLRWRDESAPCGGVNFRRRGRANEWERKKKEEGKEGRVGLTSTPRDGDLLKCSCIGKCASR